MGLFDKKYCDICGEKIGLLGNRKLEDGNLCKNCAAKLSPFFSERRRSTVEDSDGNRKSYQPPRYECDYEFDVVIRVNSPWFDSIELEISDGSRPDSPYTDLYREYERKMNELKDTLLSSDKPYRPGDGHGR